MITDAALPLPQQLRNHELKQQLALLSQQEDPALENCLDAKQTCLSKKYTLLVESQCMAEGTVPNDQDGAYIAHPTCSSSV